MNKAIAIIDMPETCGECFFCCTIEEISVGNGLYKKIGKCSLTKDIENPWRDIWWQVEHKEDWCPLKELPNRIICFGEDDYTEGYNDCLAEILGE